MPYKLTKHLDGTYSVSNKVTGKYHARHTTKENAVKQMKLLYLLEKKKG